MTWKESILSHAKQNRTYSLLDLQRHLQTKKDAKEFAQHIRQNKHRCIKDLFQTSSDWQAMVPAALMSSIAQYGVVADLPDNVISTVSEERDNVVKRFVWKSMPIEDYSEGEPFQETYLEGATNVIRWRKPAAKIVETREAAMDLPLSTMQLNLQLTMNEFKAREWKHFVHELHNATSNLFDARATLKNGESVDLHWRALHDNAYNGSSDQYATFADIRLARSKMLQRERDAIRPVVCILNASTEASLAEDTDINSAFFWGNSGTFFQTGSLPNVYGLTFVVVPDAFHGYFQNNVTRKNDTFQRTNDVFLVGGDSPIWRHTREPLSTETWYLYDGQKNSMNIWERYEYSVYRHTSIMRISKPIDEYVDGLD